MGVSLTKVAGLHQQFNWASYRALLELAYEYGWKPAGTEPGQWYNAETGELVEDDEITKELTEEFVGEFELGEAKRYIEEGFEKDRTLSWQDALANKLSAIQEGHVDTLREVLWQ